MPKMHVTKCDECGYEISIKTDRCLNCGERIGIITKGGFKKYFSRIAFIVLAIYILLSALKAFRQ